jgi:hypothetical protein
MLICALLAVSPSGCTPNLKERSYRNTAVSAVPIAAAARTNDRIDRYETYASYFRIGKAVESMKVGVSAEYVADIMGTKKTRNSYFIVEKVIDMSRLGNRNLTHLHAELGRNFTGDWTRNDKEISLVSSKSEPFKNLDADSLYRIRYTTFANENFTFTVTIKADCAVTFEEAPK